MLYHENLRKLGILIRYHRRKKHMSQEIGFTQEEFILTSSDHSFFEVDCGQPVCSRKTLCQLENGKDIQEESLYRFFLTKLGLEYAYSLQRERMYSYYFQRFDKILCFGEIAELSQLPSTIGKHRNVIYDFYGRILSCAQRFYLDAILPPSDFLAEMLALWSIVPAILKPHLRLMLLVSHVLRHDVCRYDLRNVLDFTSKHPVDLWIDAVYAVSTGRIIFSEKLLKRIKSKHASSEWLTYLACQLQTFRIVSHQGRELEDVASTSSSLPIYGLGTRILLSRLGNDAVKRQDFKRAHAYLSSICDVPDMLGLHAALFLRRSLNTFEMKNISRRTAILERYLSLDIDAQAHDKLDFLMTRLLPIVEPQDRYTKTCLFRDVQYLVTHTRKYKSLHECIDFLQLTHEPTDNRRVP